MVRNNQTGSALIIGIIIALVVIVGGAVAYFMTRSADDDTTTNTNVETTQEKSAESADDKSVAESKPLPDGYPTDEAPIYQPSTVTFTSTIGDGWMVIVESEDSTEDVARSIFDNYTALGATVSQEPLNDKGVGQVVGSNGGYGVIVTYGTDDDKNVTSISYDVKPQIKR